MENADEGQVTLKQLFEKLERIEDSVGDLATAVAELAAQNETRKKLSEAGKRSAAARIAKFGSAEPPKKVPTTLRVVEPVPEPVREITQEPFDLPDEHLPEPVQKKVHKAKKEQSAGSLVWAAYSCAYFDRYKVQPVRNAKVNGQCSQLAKQVGPEAACELVWYYLGRNDQFYVRAAHPLGLCLIDVQKLRTEQANGTVITMADARRIESGSATDRAIKQYAASQTEQVHVTEVENAGT